MVVYTEDGQPRPQAQDAASFGYLKINVSAAQRALPISNAQVMVYSSIEERQQELLAVLQTDYSGESEMISLPAPELAASLEPANSPEDQAYNLYYVRIVAANFITRDKMPVQIFPGVLSDLIVNMQTPIYIG